MGWFIDWWQGLGLTGQIMACAAIPSTIVLILQAILIVIGAGFGGDSDGFDSDGSDADIDGFDGDTADGGADGFDSDGFDSDSLDYDHEAMLDHDVFHHHHPAAPEHAVKIISIRGIIAFFAIGGWAGIVAVTSGMRTIWAVQIALLSGAAAMILASFVIKLALNMQSSGNISLNNAVSQIAEVYITIPPARSNTGKVMMILQERFTEIDAVTDSAEAIRPNTKVEVIGLANKDCLIVRPITDIVP